MQKGQSREHIVLILAGFDPEKPQPLARPNLTQHACGAVLGTDDIHPPEEGRTHLPCVSASEIESVGS